MRHGERYGERQGGMTRTGAGAATTRVTRFVRPWSLPVFAAPVLAFLLVSRSWHGVVAVALAGLAVLAVRGPVAVLGLVPLSLLGAVLPGGATVTLGAVTAVTLAVAVQVIAGGRRLQGAHLWIALLALLVLAGFLLPAGGSPPAPDRFADLVALLTGLALLAAVTAAPPPPGAVARVTAVAGGIAAAYALAFGVRAGGRLAEFGLNPNYLGALLALPFVAGAGLALQYRRPAWLLPAAVCFAGMAATQSRGAFAAAVTGVAVVVIQGRRRGVQVLIVTAAVAVGAVFPAALGAAEQAAAGRRAAAELDYDTSVREQVAWFAVRVAADHPVRGIGYGTFPSHADSEFGLRLATHDDYLRLAAETGIPALAAFLCLLWLGLRRPASAGLAVPRAMAAAYAAGLLFANVLASLVLSMPFWLALGCLLAGPRPSLDHPNPDRESNHDR